MRDYRADWIAYTLNAQARQPVRRSFVGLPGWATGVVGDTLHGQIGAALAIKIGT